MQRGTAVLAGQWEQRNLLWAALLNNSWKAEGEMDEEWDQKNEKPQLAGGKLLLCDKPKVNNE